MKQNDTAENTRQQQSQVNASEKQTGQNDRRDRCALIQCAVTRKYMRLCVKSAVIKVRVEMWRSSGGKAVVWATLRPSDAGGIMVGSRSSSSALDLITCVKRTR
eukprot:350458-Rhodomonas_salina.1